MRKRIALLSALGVAGGIFYALESQHKRNRNKSADDDSGVDGNSRSVSESSSRQAEAPHRKAASMARIENGPAAVTGGEAEHAIDDHGTHQVEATQILKSIRDTAFEASDAKLALALGRPTEEIEECTSGRGLIDGDMIMKARALALSRGLQVE